MAAYCSFFRSLTASTVCTPFSSADGSVLLVHPFVNSFPITLHAVLLRGWQRISFFRSSMAFMVCVLVCAMNGSGPPLVNGFHDVLPAVLLSRWQWIAHTSAGQRLSQRIVRSIAQRMAADCSFFCSSTTFMVCTPFCSADGSILPILPLVNGFHDGLRAIFLRGWQHIAHSSSRQCLSWFAHHFAQRIATHCSFLC